MKLVALFLALVGLTTGLRVVICLLIEPMVPPRSWHAKKLWSLASVETLCAA